MDFGPLQRSSQVKKYVVNSRITKKEGCQTMVAITKLRRVPSKNAAVTMLITAGFIFVGASVGLLYLQQLNTTRRQQQRVPIQVVIQPSLCDEGLTSNISTTLLARRGGRRGDYPYYHHISQIFEGPAMLKTTTTNTDEHAICKFRQVTYWYHFPHTMQQLYRCWSWWIANPNKKPVLIFEHHPKTIKNAFLLDFFKVLKQEINLEIVKSHDGPYVQARDTGMWDNDIEITDYAMFDPERKLRQVFAPHIPNLIPDSSCPSRTSSMNHLPKIAILNRSEKSGRYLLNANEIVSSIEQTFPGQIVPIVYFENKTMLEQVQFFMESDIVISPHGAQLTGIAFMKNCSTLIEFFPRDYLAVDYFGSLAASVGVDHKYFSLDGSEGHAQPYERYHYIPTTSFRDRNQCPHMGKVITALVDVIKSWRPCCASSASTKKSQHDQTSKISAKTPIPAVDNAQIHGTIDIVSTGRIAYLDTQQQTFGSHKSVRDFYRITETCAVDYSFDQFQQVMSSCIILQDKSRIAKQFQSELLGESSNATEWLCKHKQSIDGLSLALEKYKSGATSIPDYLISVDDDTYLNMDAMAKTLHESYSPDENHLIAGCTYLGLKKSHFVYPVGGVGSVLTRATIKKILMPIQCQGDANPDLNPFTRWACWRLEQNLLGEKRYFKDGMSVAELLKAYSSGPLFETVDKWNTIGYCFHSSHTLGYFFNYYHVSVPDWLLNETNPTDNIRKLHSYKKIAGSSEDAHTGNGGECNSLFKKCTAESRICRYVNTEQMTTIYNTQQSKR